jgi:hypothetical protein
MQYNSTYNILFASKKYCCFHISLCGNYYININNNVYFFKITSLIEIPEFISYKKNSFYYKNFVNGSH